MKTFVILGYNHRNIRDWVFNNPIDGRNFGVWGDENACTRTGSVELENKGLIMWADDLSSARAAAKAMAHHHPGISYVIARTDEVFTAAMPQELKITCAKLTEKGLVPQ